MAARSAVPIPTFVELTLSGRAGAIACIQLVAPTPSSLDAVLGRLCEDAPRTAGELAVRLIARVDRGVVVRWTPECAHLMPHGGPAVIRELKRALQGEGLREVDQVDAPNKCQLFARSAVDARALDTLSRARSPLAIGLLLEQHARWARTDPAREIDLAPDDVLRRLLDPPLVVAVGAANIGKSSLLNALAGATAAAVADTPGTTRDPVGATLVLDGLAVRWIDTPGLLANDDGGPIDEAAAGIARSFAERADLLLFCADADGQRFPEVTPDRPLIRVATRADRTGPTTPSSFDAEGVRITSAATGRGLSDLATAIRQHLVPDSVLADPRPWRFWDEPTGMT